MNEKFSEFLQYSKKKEDERSNKRIDELSLELLHSHEIIKTLKSNQELLIEAIKKREEKWEM